MKLFKKTAMSLALAATMLGGVTMTQQASAVSVAYNGLGDVLVFPYYTVRDGWRTYYHITNTSNKTVLAKVRWNEGVNSRDSRDFNIALSPNDVWTAAVVPTADGARVITTDNTCTAPVLTNNADPFGTDIIPDPLGLGLTGVNFTDIAFTGSNADNGMNNLMKAEAKPSLDRTKEGYFTVFEMGVVDTSTADGARFARWVKHGGPSNKNNTATPANCKAAADAYLTDSDLREAGRDPAAIFNFPDLQDVVMEPENVLRGTAVLINPTTGVASGYDPLVLADFFSPLGVDGAEKTDNLLAQPQTQRPDMRSGKSLSVDYVDSNGSQSISNLSSVDGVSLLLSRTALINDYNVKGVSETDWVVTFPTKAFYVDQNKGDYAKVRSGAPKSPFSRAEVGGTRFARAGAKSYADSCLNITVEMWDREEFKSAPGEVNLGFSPVPEGETAAQLKLCNEANILSFGDSNVFGSKLRSSFFAGKEDQMPGLSGWARMTFNNALNQANPLPVIGMKVEQRKDTNSPNKWFGFANDHSFLR